MIVQTELTQETLEQAQAWFQSVGHRSDIENGTLYLVIKPIWVELSQSEIEYRAALWEHNQKSENQSKKNHDNQN
jgi:hypothetical protein